MLKKGTNNIGAIYSNNVTIDENLTTELNAQLDQISNQQSLISELAQLINVKNGVTGTPEPNRPIEPSATDNAGIIDYNTQRLIEYNNKIENLITEVNTIPSGRYNISKTNNSSNTAQILTITDAQGLSNSDIATALPVEKFYYNEHEFPMSYRENLVLANNYSNFYENNSIINLGQYKFYRDDGITGISCANLQTIGTYCFYDCDGIINVILPNIVSIYEDAFASSAYIQTVDIGDKISLIDDAAFQSCTRLEKVIIRKTTGVPSLGSSVFYSSGITNGTGFIYVPNALVESYRTATNWSTYADYIDGIDLTKLTIKAYEKINIYNGNTNGGTVQVFYNDLLTQLVDASQEGYTLTVASNNATIDSSGKLTLNSGVSAGAVVTITATSTYNPSISTTVSIPVVNIAESYSVNLNSGQWIDSGTTVDGHTVYKSDAGSYNTDDGVSTAIITVTGYTTFTIYIRSYAESNFDYTEAFAIDTTASRGKGTFTTKGKQSATTYVECVYELDGGTHTIQIMYSKDGSVNNDDDRGYFYIAG